LEKNEAVDNPYAVGMAAAMKAKDDKPPLKNLQSLKHTILLSQLKKMRRMKKKIITKRLSQNA
jgi:hypothetical protein